MLCRRISLETSRDKEIGMVYLSFSKRLLMFSHFFNFRFLGESVSEKATQVKSAVDEKTTEVKHGIGSKLENAGKDLQDKPSRARRYA